MIGQQDFITFKKDTHQYFDPGDNEYESVSRVIRTVEPVFEREKISIAMAQVKSSEEGISIDIAQKQILDEWDQKRDSAIDRGNWIHDNIEAYLAVGTCDDKLISVSKIIANFVKSYYKYFQEAIIYSSMYQVAGQTDLALQRQSSRTKINIMDFFDYKTNEARGIYFDSIKRENGQIKKHYNRFLDPPLSHLEHCNFNTYSLQLSLYAYMASITFGIIVGRLGIIFINNNLQVRMYPVPYMMMEVIALLEHFKNRNKSGWEE